MATNPKIKNAIEKISDYLDFKYPVNIVSICDKLNIQVRESLDLDDNVSGLIYKDKEDFHILINACQSAGRKSFTIAHELGHYLMHKDILEKDAEIISGAKGIDLDSPACIARQDITAATSQEYRKLETEANNFAAEILMPEKEFLKQCICQNSIDDIANYFGVSISAATIRADRLGGLYFL
ncbi:ImmA/IrrE family metallo-endopeptidase [bacterium]|nr:ImmA/IrrE family metallo-endopeptidase [bacterium]